jgi:hypothetical protein
VDILAIAVNGDLRPAEPLPESLRIARDRVTRDFDLDENWLNGGPTDLLKCGLPDGLMTRIVTRRYGQALTVHFAVGETLAGLVASRVVEARWSGNERHFATDQNKWATLLEVGPSAEFMPQFVPWIDLFAASLQIISWLDNEADTEDSEYLVSSRARDLVERLTANLEVAGLDVRWRPVHGAAYLSIFADIVEAVLAKMSIAR